MIHRLLIALVLLVVSAPLAAVTSDVARDERIRVQLVSEVASVRPGEPFRVALRLAPDDEWHTYWKNPGDSGLETRLSWALPPGFQAAEIDWPWPKRLPVEHLVNYGYSGVHALPVTITPPADLPTGQPVTVEATAKWLVCKIQCIPGEATLALDLPVRDEPPSAVPEHESLFAWADDRQPREVDWPARFTTDGGRFSLQLDVPADYAPDEPAMFAANGELVDHSAATRFSRGDGLLLASHPLSDYFTEPPESVEIVLVDTAAASAVSVTATPGALGAAAPAPTAGGAGSGPGIAAALLLAVAGGLLLNLMPCVFPVLSLKALSVVEGGRRQRAHGVAYTAGVVVAFAVVAGGLLGLRAAGEAVGWGFQLQSPWFVGLLAYLLFTMGLSLSGVVELGGRWMGIGQDLTRSGGLAGSFFTGVLACVVASPCTAPFMGTALGFAVTQPAPQAMAVFLALGLGLALPILVIGFVPGLARALPRPGPWMVTFRQAMAFPLYLTVVWLVWVLARQTDANGLAAVLGGLVVLAFALWLWGRPMRSRPGVVLRRAGVAVSLAAAFTVLGWAGNLSATRGDDPGADAAWQAWSPERMSRLREEGRPVFVNMTADWCVTCLVNERVALDTERVRDVMEERGIAYLKGDWTRRDSDITEFLARFERTGVPLYVFYPRGRDAEPRVLPQVLTPGLVVEALQTDTD